MNYKIMTKFFKKMNKEDVFYFFLFKALTDFNSNVFYYFELENKLLFSLKVNGDKLIPIYRNTQSQIKFDKFIDLIKKVEQKDNRIITLPKISYIKKKEFLFEFINNITDKTLKEILQNEYNNFKQDDNFNEMFVDALKRKGNRISYKYHIDYGIFLNSQINELISPLSIDKSSTVIW
jgi:hypothetical protein